MGNYRKPSRIKPFKIIFLVVFCSLLGGVIVYYFSDKIHNLAHNARERGLLGVSERSTSDASDTEGERMKPAQMEREIKRLRKELDAKDRENADLKIQLKLFKEGSRTKE